MIARAVSDLPPHTVVEPDHATRFERVGTLTIRPELNFVNIGERTNVTGSTEILHD